MKMNHLIWGYLCMMIFLSCQPLSKTITIDNPSEEKLQIVLDGNEAIEINAGESKRVMTKFGKREITVNDGEPMSIHLKSDRDYLLNPTLSNYYVENVYYFFSESARESHMRYNRDTIQIGGMAINGQFRRIQNQLLIPKDWSFGPDEDVKQMVKVQKRTLNQDYHMTKKVHREKDLLARAFQMLIMEKMKNQEFDK